MGSMVQCYLIRKSSFWSIKENTSSGSWVWRKLLKLRGLAKQFIKKEVRNGECTSFWYDRWSKFDTLKDLLGERGPLEFGVPDHYSVAEAKRIRRRRRNHRIDILNQIEEELTNFGNDQDDDIVLWKHSESRYRNTFSTSKTWNQIRSIRSTCVWHKAVWFSQHTPKQAFIMWIALKERLQTTDRIQQWNRSINTNCVLCNEECESCGHLFFDCRYSGMIWKKLMEGLMREDFTVKWSDLIAIASKLWLTPIKTFILCYALQPTMYTIWWEHNARRHGEKPRDENLWKRILD